MALIAGLSAKHFAYQLITDMTCHLPDKRISLKRLIEHLCRLQSGISTSEISSRHNSFNSLGLIGSYETSRVSKAIFYGKIVALKIVERKDSADDELARKSYELLKDIESSVNVVKMFHCEESVMFR